MDRDILALLTACDSGDLGLLDVDHAKSAQIDALERALILGMAVLAPECDGVGRVAYLRTPLGRAKADLPERIPAGFLGPGDIVLSPTGGRVADVSVDPERPEYIDVTYEGEQKRTVRAPRFRFVEVYRG